MKTYFEAYRERMQNVNNELLQIADQLTSKGFEVYYAKDGLISFIHVQNADKHIIFGFTDVPYRWYLSYNITPSKEHGSGKTLKEIATTENPFTIGDIIKAMQPNVQTIMSSKQYLNLHSLTTN